VSSSPPSRFAEDYRAGEEFDLGSYRVTREEIVDFATKYDPFPFHVDEKAAQATPFGGIIRQRLDDGARLAEAHAPVFPRPRHDARIAGARGGELADAGEAGDTLTGKVAIRESRISRSKPGMGFVRYTATLQNERGECVFVTTSTIIVRARGEHGS